MESKYDYLIVGAGFFGAICAHELSKKGFICLVIDKKQHIGGNCYTEKRDNINIHIYGPHIFHTSNDRVWKWINQYATFNNFRLMPVANYKGEIYSLPFNMWTFNQLWGVKTPEEARKIIDEQASEVQEPTNLEEQAIKSVGRDVYVKLIKGYTAKQWMRPPDTLPKEIIKRLPVRFTYDSNYFNDKYQGIPIGGYTPIFEKLLEGIEVRLGIDFIKSKNKLSALANKVIYTGPIDEFFDYQFGELEYKSTLFDHQRVAVENYQGTPMMNYTDIDTPFTRIVEHKHFESSNSPVTWVTWEYPQKYQAGITEPYYPVNDEINNLKFNQYLELSQSLKNVLFGGRLADYKYYDMHNVIERALEFVDQESAD
jgi:UDP-galactopyranose mutase